MRSQTIAKRRRYVFGMLCVAALCIGGCKGCNCGGNQGTGGACPVGTQGTTAIQLTRQGAASDGTLIYGGGTSDLPSTCTNRLDYFTIQGVAVPVSFAEGGDPSKCRSSSVVLTALTHPKSDPGEVAKVFGDLHPKLPVNFVACVQAGGSPPDVIAVAVTYTTTSN